VLKIAAIVAKSETMSDGGMKVVLNTNEMPPEDMAMLMGFHNKYIWAVLSETDTITEDDIPDERIEFEGQKTLSERLRNVLFRLHEAQKGKPEDFEAYRVKIMEGLINTYKSRLADYDQDKSF
jgi:hypothetical protein